MDLSPTSEGVEFYQTLIGGDKFSTTAYWSRVKKETLLRDATLITIF